MNYRSVAQLADLVRASLHKIPPGVELVVGVPRSGMLAASLVALNLNVDFCDVGSYIENRRLGRGRTRLSRFPHLVFPRDAKRVLVIDDSTDTGTSLQVVRELLLSDANHSHFTFAAVFATEAAAPKVDCYFEIVPQPRSFEWNIMHRPFIGECCVDIDGVLCVDPTPVENDDGVEYGKFLLSARSLVIPSYPVGHLVTSRLEKYRKETEAWLEKCGVVYGALHMLDLPDGATRRRLGCHAEFKTKVFRKLHYSKLFVESEPHQARHIARHSGKPALCFTTQQLFGPSLSLGSLDYSAQRLARGVYGRIVSGTRRVFNRLK
ncbi:MAG: phosphoribosyltransferase family protein [Burkholderiaceae bacterium]